jgi:hypothetical protein
VRGVNVLIALVRKEASSHDPEILIISSRKFSRSDMDQRDSKSGSGKVVQVSLKKMVRVRGFAPFSTLENEFKRGCR